jgi:Helix-turn-helix domain of resolvase/Transposase
MTRSASFPTYRGRRRSPKPAPPREGAARQPRHARWVAIDEAVRPLRAQGTPIATMARQSGISRPTVYAYLRRDTPPGPRQLQRRPSARVLTPYTPYLIRRWRESGADSRQLWREMRAPGFAHSARTVCRFITRLRRASDGGYAPELQASPYTRPQGPSARAVSFVMVCPAAHRSDAAQQYLDQFCRVDARIALARFARGLQEDLAAVTAGVTLPWSNGPVEGQITRLKLLKRQGYGRTGFALLRQRVLQAA